jgi:hypothetical protein
VVKGAVRCIIGGEWVMQRYTLRLLINRGQRIGMSTAPSVHHLWPKFDSGAQTMANLHTAPTIIASRELGRYLGTLKAHRSTGMGTLRFTGMGTLGYIMISAVSWSGM